MYSIHITTGLLKTIALDIHTMLLLSSIIVMMIQTSYTVAIPYLIGPTGLMRADSFFVCVTSYMGAPT